MFPTCIAAAHCQLAHTFLLSRVVALTFTHTDTRVKPLARKFLASDVILRSRHEIETSINPPDRDDCLLATHPSDHNAVYVDVVSHKFTDHQFRKGKQSEWSRSQLLDSRPEPPVCSQTLLSESGTVPGTAARRPYQLVSFTFRVRTTDCRVFPEVLLNTIHPGNRSERLLRQIYRPCCKRRPRG